MDIPRDLQEGLDSALAGVRVRELSPAVERIMAQYRSGALPHSNTLGSATGVAAYAAYRMPATYAAVRATLSQLQLLVPEYAPTTHLDVGGGTGAAVWAAVDAFPTLSSSLVLDRAPHALAMGRLIAQRALSSTVRETEWRQTTLERIELPHAELITASYVLGELSETDRTNLVARLQGTGGMVVLVEPGTPLGYERILQARSELVSGGFHLVAPCPHSGVCPLADREDWCHFAVRINRSALHRQVKKAELGYEDEKFSYVIASADQSAAAQGRVIRHPATRKGLVSLTVCSDDNTVHMANISKRQGRLYKDARGREWGDAWPPVPAEHDEERLYSHGF